MNGLILLGDVGSVAQAAADRVASWSYTDWVPILLGILAILRQIGFAPQVTDALAKVIQAIFKINPAPAVESSTESPQAVVEIIDSLSEELKDVGLEDLADRLQTEAMPRLVRRRFNSE